MSHVVLLLSSEALTLAYPEPVLARLRSLADSVQVISPAESWKSHPEVLQRADVIFSGWGAPRMDDAFLRHAPNVRAIFYAAGSIRYFLTDAVWRRGIRITTAQAQNAVPVAEFAAASLLLGLKRVWHYGRITRDTRAFPADRPMPGAYQSTVGLISYGTIARLVRERLRALDVKVVVFDPFLTPELARAEEVTAVSLDEVFSLSDAVSVHTPYLPETECLIRGRHLERLRPGSFFLNTARGEVVAESEMIDVLRRRPDLQALLDVTAPEPPPADSPLYQLPNVLLTPHIAGSMGAECERMGMAMVDEWVRYRAGQPLRWEITEDRAALSA